MHHPSLKYLLNKWALQDYYEKFKNHGVETVEILLKMTEDDIGLVIPISKLNDRATLRIHLREYKQENVSIQNITKKCK